MKRSLSIAMMLVAGIAHAEGKAVNAAQAKAKALALVPGKVIEVEKEKHKGEPVFSVEIRAADGVHEVVIRIADGLVLENKAKGEHEDDDGDEGEESHD